MLFEAYAEMERICLGKNLTFSNIMRPNTQINTRPATRKTTYVEWLLKRK